MNCRLLSAIWIDTDDYLIQHASADIFPEDQYGICGEYHAKKLSKA